MCALNAEGGTCRAAPNGKHLAHVRLRLQPSEGTLLAPWRHPMLNPRGTYTVLLTCDYSTQARLVSEVPGVTYSGDGRGVLCAWSDVPLLAERLGKPIPKLPEDPLEQLPGYADYQAFLARAPKPPRPYQVEDAVWLANRHSAFLCNPMRSGKTYTTLLAAMLARHKRILVLCPGISRWVWGDEARKWLGVEPYILTGLSLDRALQYCGTCQLRGRLADGSRCPDCKQRNGSTYGYRIQEIRETEEPPLRLQKKTGAVLWRCRKHLDVTSPPDKPIRCPECKTEMLEALKKAEVVVVSYDVLFGKGYRDRTTDRVLKRADLPGWGKVLPHFDWDICIIDESHHLRAFQPGKKYEKTVAARVRRLLPRVPTVWMVTGTPIFGRVRDLYGQLDVATNGMWGAPSDWALRYCAAHQAEYGWDTTGRSNEDELKARLKPLMVSRPRSEILKDMPPKERRIVYIDNDKPVKRKLNGSPEKQAAALIDAIAPLKHDVVIENVLNELSEGLKTYILVFRPKHAERLARNLTKRMNSKQWRSRMNHVKAEVFLGQTETGIDTKRRRDLAHAFCAYQGAAAFVATIGTMPGSISLRGVQTVHFCDFSPNPSAMEQAEDRGYEPGIPGYSITHYIVRNSIDQDLEQVVLPKFRTKDAMFDDESAQHYLAVFDSASDRVDMEAVMRRHLAHLQYEDEDE